MAIGSLAPHYKQLYEAQVLLPAGPPPKAFRFGEGSRRGATGSAA